MKSLLMILTTFFCFFANARVTDNQIQTKIIENKIELTSKPGFHLNSEAPASAKFDNLNLMFKPEPKTAKKFVFTGPEKFKNGEIKFYVCDDQKTVCEQHQMNVSLENLKNSSINKSEKNLGKKSSRPVLIKSGRPLFLMFSAPWCPACIRMQTETYSNKKIQSEIKNLKIKKINIDLPENAEWVEKFHIQAIPTAILLNKDEEEVRRWLDFQEVKVFAAQLHESIKKSLALQTFEKQALAGNQEAISHLGLNAYSSMNCLEAIRWLRLSKHKQDKVYELASEVMCAEGGQSQQNKENYLMILEKASGQTTAVIDKIRWSIELLEQSKENKTNNEIFLASTNKLLKLINDLPKEETKLKALFDQSSYGDTGGFENEEIVLMKSRIYEIQGQEKEKKMMFAQIKDSLSQRKLSTDNPGEMLMAISYFREAGEKSAVEDLYGQLIREYPKTYVYFEKYARYLFFQKENEKALANINKAFAFPEGNEPQLFLLKAKILKDMKEKDAALATLAEMLKLEKISHKKYKKILAQAESLKKELTTDLVQD